VHRNGVQIFPNLWQALDEAEHTIDVQCFEIAGDRTAATLYGTLLSAARRGLKVRFLIDPAGGREFRGEWVEDLRKAGAEVRKHDTRHLARLGLQNYRIHQRVVLLDGVRAFGGGFGFADRWLGDAGGPDEYRDYAVEVRGPAAAVLGAAFNSTWAANGGWVTGPEQERGWPEPAGEHEALVVRASCGPIWNDAATLYETLVRTAEKRVRMAMGYFTPPQRLIDLFAETVERGVEVELIVPGPIMKRRVSKWAGESRFDDLRDAGVAVYRYQPARLHAKVVTVDGVAAVVGSINLDARSLSLDAEVGVLFGVPELVAAIDRDLDTDRSRSIRVDDGWRHAGPLEAARDRVARTLSPWL
jgi:cardiolipin synthase A/B